MDSPGARCSGDRTDTVVAVVGLPTAGKTTLVSNLDEFTTVECYPDYVGSDEEMPPYPRDATMLTRNCEFSLRYEAERQADVARAGDGPTVVDTSPLASVAFLNVVAGILDAERAIQHVFREFTRALRRGEAIDPDAVIWLDVSFGEVRRRWRADRTEDLLWTDERVHRTTARILRRTFAAFPALRIDSEDHGPAVVADRARSFVESVAGTNLQSRLAGVVDAVDWAAVRREFGPDDERLLVKRGVQ